MSFISRYIEFYEFTRGAQVWRHVTENKPLVYLGQSYNYENIKRSGLSESGDLTRNVLDLSVPTSMALLDLYRGQSPTEDIAITLYRQRKSDGVVEVRWVGIIGDVEWSTNKAIIHGIPPMASLRGNGLNRNWQKGCPLVVYSVGLGQCNADRESMRVNATIITATGAVVTAAAFGTKPDGWFEGGWIEWKEGAATERRYIQFHTGTTLTLLTPARVPVGTVVATYPGCAGTLTICDTKFDNAVNYGGDPWIPEKNPFGADPIY